MSRRNIPTTREIASTIAKAAGQHKFNALRATVGGKEMLFTANLADPDHERPEGRVDSVTMGEPRSPHEAQLAPEATGKALDCIRDLFGF